MCKVFTITSISHDYVNEVWDCSRFSEHSDFLKCRIEVSGPASLVDGSPVAFVSQTVEVDGCYNTAVRKL